MLPHCGVVFCCQTQVIILKAGFDKVCEGHRDPEEVKGSPEEDVGDWAKGIGEVQKHHMKIISLLFGDLDLMPDGASVFQTTGEAWDSCFLDWGVNQVVSLQSLSHDDKWCKKWNLTLTACRIN